MVVLPPVGILGTVDVTGEALPLSIYRVRRPRNATCRRHSICSGNRNRSTRNENPEKIDSSQERVR